MNGKKVLLNIDLADVGTFFVVLWPLMALFLSILCWCSIGTPPKRSKEPGFKGLLQMWSTPAYHAVLSLLVRWTGGKHRGLQAKLPKPFSPSPACQRSWRLDTETKQETEQPCLILIQKRCQDVLFFCPSVDQTSGPRLCKFVLGRPCHACCFILSCRSAGMRITSDCSYAFNFTTCIQRCNTPHQPSDIMLNPCSIK